MATFHTSPKKPLVVIVGATGTGKSRLAVSLASRFGGEIINADAMQMYKGLPIITNKIPEHERNSITHHMLDFIGLEEKPWTVQKFVDEAGRIIEDVRGRRRLPIVVGGTGYYVHGLLVKDGLLGSDEENMVEGWGEAGKGEGEGFKILQGSAEEMHAQLMELDPDMARSWHPKDRRRIQRSLEICLKTGRKASDVYKEQKERKKDTGDTVERGLRYNTLILWLEAEDSVLKERLNSRVDSMVADGLLDEVMDLSEMERSLTQQGRALDKGKGIWVSIGYKELEPWAAAQAADHVGFTQKSRLALECIEAVKAGTRQYAKRQNRYVRIRLANALKDASELDKLFLLDSTDLTQWDDCVERQSSELVSAFLAGLPLPEVSTLSGLAEQTFAAIAKQDSRLSSRVAHYCQVCDKMLMTAKEHQQHLESRSHKKAEQSKRQRALWAGSVAVEIQGGEAGELPG